MVQHLPRRKLITAASEAQDIAIFLDACCQANSDNPPLVVATDCHFSFDLFHRILVGLVKKTEFQDLPFLRFVRPGSAQVKSPLFPFLTMVYKGDASPVYGTSDPKRIMKAVSRALRSPKRVLKMFLVNVSAYFYDL